MFLPYRAKNPPERFPFLTVSLMVLNIGVFALTSEDFLIVRPEAVQQFAVSHFTLSLYRLVTAMFLHASLFHLAGNMLFLWLLGPSVEGRLKSWKYLTVYFTAGILGGLVSDLVNGLASPDRYSLGASGAIMGIAGVYLYAFPYSAICIFWWWWYRVGVVDLQARWLILLYVGLDVLEQAIFGGADGVGHYAHIGGCAVGLGLAFLLKTRRDDETYSAAQAMRTEVGNDFSAMKLEEMEALAQNSGASTDVVMGYLSSACSTAGYRGPEIPATILKTHHLALLRQADPARLGRVAVMLADPAHRLPVSFYHLLGARVEGAGSYEIAIHLYRIVNEIDPNGPDGEMALYRAARMLSDHAPDKGSAVPFYEDFLRRYPNSEWAPAARNALSGLRSGLRPAV